MTRHQETARRAGGAAGLEDTSFPGGNGFHIAPNSTASQAENYSCCSSPLPSFLELVTENCEGYFHNIIRYAQICLLHGDARDYDGFIDSVDKLIGQTRELASTARPLKKPLIISHEKADAFEREAESLRGRVYLFETEASNLRAAASIGGSP